MANIKRANTSGITKTGTAIPDVPDAPNIGTATAGEGSATVTYTAAATGGAVTTFTATSSPGSITGTGASPITVSGLTNGTAYTFTVKGTNSTATGAESAASNSVTPIAPKFGYIAGGYVGSSMSSSIYRIAFSDDTTSLLSAKLEQQIEYMAAMANSGTAGYMAAGRNGGNTPVTIQKLSFPGETRTTISATIEEGNNNGVSANANSGTAGYFYGGETNSSGGTTSVIQKLTFSNESRSTLSAKLTERRYQTTAFANSGTAGYIAGGQNPTTEVTNIDKLAFSNDTVSLISGKLSEKRRLISSVANSGTAGYIGGGFNGSAYLSNVNKLTFSNDTVSTVSNTLAQNAGSRPAFANSGTAGYFVGGNDSNGIPGFSTVNKLTFSNDAIASLGTNFGVSFAINAGFANSGTL